MSNNLPLHLPACQPSMLRAAAQPDKVLMSDAYRRSAVLVRHNMFAVQRLCGHLAQSRPMTSSSAECRRDCTGECTAMCDSTAAPAARQPARTWSKEGQPSSTAQVHVAAHLGSSPEQRTWLCDVLTTTMAGSVNADLLCLKVHHGPGARFCAIVYAQPPHPG